MDVLIVLGTTMAWIFSTAVTLLGLRAQHVHFEAGAAVITLVLLGKLLRARATLWRRQPTSCSAASTQRSARRARAVAADIPLAEVVIGDRDLVRAGESVPVDGVVEDGAPRSTKSMLTERAGRWQKCPATVFRRHRESGWNALLLGEGGRQHDHARRHHSACRRSAGSKAPIQRLADKVSGVSCPSSSASRADLHLRLVAERDGCRGADQRGRRPGHCLSMRPGPCYTDGDHGRHGTRCAGWHADTQRDRARKRGAHRRADRRQDGTRPRAGRSDRCRAAERCDPRTAIERRGRARTRLGPSAGRSNRCGGAASFRRRASFRRSP